MSTALRFNAMHFMPYVHLPPNYKDYPSGWVNFPNKYYDPKKGSQLYQRYLKELVLADQLGYDALVVNEHHNTIYSMMAAPNLIAAALVPQTTNARICVWGTPPNLMLPNRLAEEYAMLDVMSGGRLEVAFPLGTGMEYWAHPVNPATARDKFRESLAIILQAWKEDGPTTHYGTHYTYRFLNRHRVRKLALIAPAGVIDPKHPTLDILALPGEQLPGLLVSNFEVLRRRLPAKPDLDFMGERYREATTVTRLLWEHPADPKFMRYLHRITVPTLILWGEDDKIIPVQQAETWRRLVPTAEIRTYKGAGHLVHLEKPEAVEAVANFLG